MTLPTPKAKRSRPGSRVASGFQAWRAAMKDRLPFPAANPPSGHVVLATRARFLCRCRAATPSAAGARRADPVRCMMTAIQASPKWNPWLKGKTA